jgi:hypothetical protein
LSVSLLRFSCAASGNFGSLAERWKRSRFKKSVRQSRLHKQADQFF